MADTVMEYQPPVGWADVATKHDLDAQNVLFEAKLDAGLARVSGELSDRLRTQTLVMCTTLIAGMGVVAALARG